MRLAKQWGKSNKIEKSVAKKREFMWEKQLSWVKYSHLTLNGTISTDWGRGQRKKC